MNTITRPPHPGRGGEARATPKGRTQDPRAEAEIALLLGARPRSRDLLIEYLHLVQDAHGQISAAHLAALAQELRISLVEAYEVATFYAHFDVVKEDDAPPPSLTIRVCDSIACQLAGAEGLIAKLAATALPDTRIQRAPCIGQCACAPAAVVGQNVIAPATSENIRQAAAARAVAASGVCEIPFEAYSAKGGYALFEKLLAGDTHADALLETLDKAGLRGMGGAGFPAARKWRAVRNMPGRKAMIVNADEGEPGTFKDRYILERDPHRVLEGALIAAHVAGANEIYFYLRDEYAGLRDVLTREIAKLPERWPVVHLRRGAGSYVCGEESALIESLEGKRGYPRQRPPLPFEAGLFGRPTLTNNVETLFFVREIIEHGADWWRAQGRNGAIGLRHYSVSGRVRNPGVMLAPAGVSVRDLVNACGGMSDGHDLRAYLPGGASGGILPASLDHLPLDFGALEPHGCFIGSAAVVVLSQADDLKAVARNLMHFFADESCGQCTPCRVGTAKAVQLMGAPEWDLALLGELSDVMRDASICGLGQAAPNPVLSLVRHFPHVFAEVRA
jgi:NADH:ubiquinone oxidoreductase subunit F (NADH-binding)/NADH:ubiquinone oxidoreductase subunit E